MCEERTAWARRVLLLLVARLCLAASAGAPGGLGGKLLGATTKIHCGSGSLANEIPDGNWGAGGRIVRLADIAALTLRGSAEGAGVRRTPPGRPAGRTDVTRQRGDSPLLDGSANPRGVPSGTGSDHSRLSRTENARRAASLTGTARAPQTSPTNTRAGRSTGRRAHRTETVNGPGRDGEIRSHHCV